MSTLEKAYLKAMKVAEDAGEDEKKSIIEQATRKLPKVSKKNVAEIASSRVGSQRQFYSNDIEH